MKSKNFTKEYLLITIGYLSKEIAQCKYRIQTCETVIKKEKKKLNNFQHAHNELWLWRDTLKTTIKHKQEYQKQLKKYQKIYTQKFNYQPRKTYIICF